MDKIAVFGTGVVGNTIATKLVQLDYKVMMGSRTASNEKAVAWAVATGKNGSTGTFKEAAEFADIIFNCTKGESATEVFKNAGLDLFKGKLIIDVSNQLDFSKGMPPLLI